MEDLDEIVHEFLVESHENLDQLDSDLVALERSPGSRDLLGSIFRTIHTIKGTSGFLAFGALEKLTHAGENLLVELRDGRRSMDPPTTDVLLRMVDGVRSVLASIEATGTEGDLDVAPVVAQITAVLDAGPGGTAAETEVVTGAGAVVPGAEVPPEPSEVPARKGTRVKAAARPAVGAPVKAARAKAVKAAPAKAAPAKAAPAKVVTAAPARAAAATPAPGTRVKAPVNTPVNAPVGTAVNSPAKAPVNSPAKAPVQAPAKAAVQAPAQPVVQAPVEPRTAQVPHPHAPANDAPVRVAPTDPAPDLMATDAGAPGAGPSRTAADASIRVDVELLDVLMRQVGELVLARNAITRLADGTVDVDLVRASQRLSLIASELQEGVMKTRMQPIEHVWSKVPRMVRDLAAACDRQVRLEMIGGDTELDRSLLEAIKDPLTHLIRNAIDHGIESGPERVAAGKDRVGQITLRASHAGGQVVVEISDDGSGIDPERVAAKAVERGLRTAQQAAAMAPAELLQLLFLPGFSTAESVTNVSGRGVGMDVVRTKIEAIGGAVDVESVVGAGTLWRLRIPLTLAIMPALTVECDGELYAIPQVSLLELVALEADAAKGGIEYVGSALVYRLRGALLPLVDLREVFQAGPRAADAGTVIAVLQADTQRFGLIVDRVLNTEEIVVKPMSARLKSVGVYAGATLLGDGRVSLILDVQAIARRSMAGELGETARAGHPGEASVTREAVQMLVAGIGDGRRVAIPLAAVTRLEKLSAGLLEHVGGRAVVQYRGAITPVVQLGSLLGAAGGEQEDLTVVVCTRGARSVAIVVDEIVDIVDDDSALHSDLGDQGLTGSTVLKDRVTELLDVRSAVEAADPLFYSDGADAVDDEASDPADVSSRPAVAELVGV